MYKYEWKNPSVLKTSGKLIIEPYYMYLYIQFHHNTLKPVLSGHSKTDKTEVLKACGTLMQVKSTAECSTGVEHSAILLTCIKQLSVLKTYTLVFFGSLSQVLLYAQSHFFH